MRFDGEFSWVRGEGRPCLGRAVPAALRVAIWRCSRLAPGCACRSLLARYDSDAGGHRLGVERSLLERAYGAFAATGAVEGAGKVLAGPGLVQHGAAGPGGARGRCGAAAARQHRRAASYLGGAANEGLADAMGLARPCFCGDLPLAHRGRDDSQAWLRAHTEPAGAVLCGPVPWCRPCASGGARTLNGFNFSATMFRCQAPAGGASFSKALRTVCCRGVSCGAPYWWGARLQAYSRRNPHVARRDRQHRTSRLRFWERVEDPLPAADDSAPGCQRPRLREGRHPGEQRPPSAASGGG